MVRWFARFPATAESRVDTYLLDPQLPRLSVKVRGGGALDVKAYRGSPGVLEVAGRARGRLEYWYKWSFPLQPRWEPPTPVTRRVGGRGCARGGGSAGSPWPADKIAAARRAAGRGAGVRGGTHRDPHGRPGLVDPGLRGDRPRRPAPQRTPGHRSRSCSPRPCQAAWNPARRTQGPTHSGWTGRRERTLTPGRSANQRIRPALWCGSGRHDLWPGSWPRCCVVDVIGVTHFNVRRRWLQNRACLVNGNRVGGGQGGPVR